MHRSGDTAVFAAGSREAVAASGIHNSTIPEFVLTVMLRRRLKYEGNVT
jgi:hypothetical protein